ncbi:MAG: tRNA (cytidine(34)-2'-O)-methyltransferase [Eubacterium sp.]|nr:tRNA (cytidine(34)-2'-O)-methyltransferase [Eubacterium sp.]
MLNIVLLEPEIPANTGNIGRTCVAVGAKLHLIEPMGFVINDKQVKRAGLDYWDKLDYQIYDSYPDFLRLNPGVRPYMATTKAKHIYSDVNYEENCYVMFGKESAGIPEEILVTDPERCVRIPMFGDIRSLNLGNSVAVFAYEVARQHGFTGLSTQGDLHRLSW